MTNPIMDFRLKLEIEIDNKSEDLGGITIADEYGNPNKGLDMECHIVKSNQNKPENSTIKIYNLASSTYNEIYQHATAFRLSCARGDTDYVPFYTGFPIRATTVAKKTILTSNEGFMKQDANAGRAGQNDLETEITLMNYGIAKLYKSYRTSVSKLVVLEDCMAALGLPKGNWDKAVLDRLQYAEYKEGHNVRGLVSEELTQMGKMYNFTWNTNDMKLNLYDKGHEPDKTFGIKLTPQNSAMPERQDDKFKARQKVIQRANKKKGITGIKATWVEVTKQGFKIRTQLLPHLQVGATCFLEDFGIAGAEGNMYIYRLEHTANNTGLEAYTDIYCV